MTKLLAHLGGPRAPWIALVSGLLSAFAYQPVGLWPLMPLAFALLAAMLSMASTWKRAALIGWTFGLGQFVLGLNWIATAFTFQAAMPAFFGWIAVVLLSFYLSVYPMLAALAGWLARKSPSGLALALAGGWGIGEWLRANVFTGFSWNPVGVALVDTPWREASATIGTYGLSAFVVLLGAALWVASRRNFVLPSILGASLILLPALPDPIVTHHTVERTKLLGAQSVPPPAPSSSDELPPPPSEFPPVPPAPPPFEGEDEGFGVNFLPIRVVQPNIPQDEKYLPGADAVAAGRLLGLSQDVHDVDSGPPAIVFWPEAAMTRPMRDERRIGSGFALRQRELAASSLARGAVLITGGVGIDSTDGMNVTGATNSVYAIDSEGGIVGSYDKAHLVPYGEYLPMRWLLEPLGLSRLVPGSLDFTPGPGARTVELPSGLKVGLQVCYEIIFSGEVVDPDNRPSFIFNPSNDAWFGAWGPPQHLAQARLRAAEEGLPVVRSTPTGISAVIAADGSIVDRVGMGERGVIDTILPVPAMRPTPFSRLGNLLPLLLCAFLILTGVALARRTR